MTRKINSIPNPNRISAEELDFIQSNPKVISSNKENYKGRMVSMSDSFYAKLNKYLQENPTEGNRSSFIVRVVAEYIKIKTPKS